MAGQSSVTTPFGSSYAPLPAIKVLPKVTASLLKTATTKSASALVSSNQKGIFYEHPHANGSSQTAQPEAAYVTELVHFQKKYVGAHAFNQTTQIIGTRQKVSDQNPSIHRSMGNIFNYYPASFVYRSQCELQRV